jgi:Tfp pilus assembly protein PilZ
MKTVLDLVGEFAALNDEKTRCGGMLPPDSERRWSELKGFYDLLMAQNGVTRRPVTRRFSAHDIRRRVKDRQRLRVPADLYVVSKFGDEYYPGQVVNLSRGGAFLATETIFPVQAELILFLANPYGGQVALFETEGKVIWTTEGVRISDLPTGMGIRFEEEDPQDLVHRQLDAIVIETLERHLSGVDSSAIAPHFLERESLVL